MAIQTRYAGDAQGINNFDAKTDGTLGTIISTGLTKAPVALKISGMGTFIVKNKQNRWDIYSINIPGIAI